MSSKSIAARAQLRREAEQVSCTLTIAEQVLAVASLLASDKTLRTALADAGQPESVRAAVVHELLAGKVDPVTASLVAHSVCMRWADGDELVDTLDELGATVALIAAQTDHTLDAVEEELFRFSRAVEVNPELQMTLTNPALAAAGKAAVVRDLVAGAAAPTTTTLLTHMAANLRGRRVDAAVQGLMNLAAAQRDRLVAHVRAAIALDASQQERLSAALSRLVGRAVRINIIVDPTVIGGASVRIGDEVIDGTMLTRLSQARRSLVGQ